MKQYPSLSRICDRVSVASAFSTMISSPFTLAQLPVGIAAVIEHLPFGRPALTRLRELGLVPGTTVEVVRRAPLGEPIEILVRGSYIAMRNHEAAFIEVSSRAAS